MIMKKRDVDLVQLKTRLIRNFAPAIFAFSLSVLLWFPLGQAAAQPVGKQTAVLTTGKPMPTTTPTAVANLTTTQDQTAVTVDHQQVLSDTMAQLTSAMAANQAALTAIPGSDAYIEPLVVELTELRDENDEALVCITSLGATYNAADILSNLLSPPFDFAATMAAYGSNLGLKFCAPVLVVPPPVTRDQEPGTCYASFYQPRINGEYSNIYGFPFPLDNNITFGPRWGELGTPVTFHWNTDVRISVDHDGEESGSYLRFPVGYNPLIWRGDTLIHPMDYVPLYVPGPGPDADNKVERENLRELIKLGLASFDQSMRQTLNSQTNPHADVYNQQIQYVIVRDLVTPSINFQPGQETITLEAVEPGGLTSGNYLGLLANNLLLEDDCDESPQLSHRTDRFWPLGVTSAITWTVQDEGPNSQGNSNQATAVQYIEIVDTKPPIMVAPAHIVTETNNIPATIKPGLASHF